MEGLIHRIDQRFVSRNSVPVHSARITADEWAEIKAENERLHELLSGWYESWNDGSDPDGDLLDDTHKALKGDEDNL